MTAGTGPATDVDAIVDRITADLTLLAGQVLDGRVDDVALLASVERLARLERQVAAERLRRIAELDRPEAAAALGARSTADMLAARLGQTRGEAKRDTETAAGLAQLPKTAEAMRKGDIGSGHAQAAARALSHLGAAAADGDTVAALDELVAETAPQLNRTQLTTTVERFAHEHGSPHLGARDRRAFPRRSLRRWTDRTTGLRRYDLALPPQQAAVVDTAIDAAITRGRHHTTTRGSSDERTPEQRGADAITELASHWLACPEIDRVAGTQTQVLVITTPAAQARLPGAEPAELDGYGVIGSATAQLLACDAQIRPVAKGRNGQVLDVGRSRRDPTPAQRAAVIARDRGCVGCGAPVSRCQIHHIRSWSRGGPTDEPNLVLVCWTCHDNPHHHGWTVTGDHIRGFALKPPPLPTAAPQAPPLAARHSA